MDKQKEEDLSVYRVGRLTLLQLMGMVAVIGIVATWVVHRLFFVN